MGDWPFRNFLLIIEPAYRHKVIVSFARQWAKGYNDTVKLQLRNGAYVDTQEGEKKINSKFTPGSPGRLIENDAVLTEPRGKSRSKRHCGKQNAV